MPSTLRTALLLTLGCLHTIQAPAAEEARPAAPAGPTALRRLEYDGLFPLYSRETFEDGGETVTAAFALYRREREGSGARALHLIPLYLSGSGADRDHQVVLPVFARWRVGPSRHLLLWPFLHAAREPEEVPFASIPTLFRHGSDLDGEDRQRLGVPPLLSLLERSSGKERTAYSVGTFYLPLLLARLRRGNHELALDVLFPLGHYRRSGDHLEVRALPFFDRTRDPLSSTLGVGGFLYRESEDIPSETSSRWALCPLVHWKTAPGERLVWAIPAFYHSAEIREGRRVHATLAAPGFLYREERRTEPDGREWSSRDAHLWPLIGHHRAGSGPAGPEETTWSTLYPLFRLERDRWRGPVPEGPEPKGTAPEGTELASETTVHAPWPLLRHRQGRDSFDFRLFPVASARWQRGSEAAFRVDPFLGWWEREQASLSWGGALGLVAYRSDAEGMRFRALPLGYGERRGERGALGIWPFYFADFSPEREEAASGIRHLFGWNTVARPGLKRHSLFWKAFEYTREDETGHDLRIFHRLFVHRRAQGQSELAVGPFFRSIEDERTGRKTVKVLGVPLVVARASRARN